MTAHKTIEAAQAHADRMNGIHSHAGTRSMGYRHRVVATVKVSSLYHVMMLSEALAMNATIVTPGNWPTV